MPRYAVVAIAFVSCCLAGAWSASVRADQPDPAAAQAAPNVAELAARLRDSVVVIKTTGRDGHPLGVGSGFVLTAQGLVATNAHVIGDARPIRVELADGRALDVVEIFATDAQADLALVRIEADGLKPLELGDSDDVTAGQPVVALGNPIGLEHSVVAGVVSATREIDGRPMLQLAIPVESGNSGGPVVDLAGRVLGLVTIKSAVTPNLGFAVTVNQLKPLIERPNPIPMKRWLTIGQLSPDEWTTVFGARWRQHAGRIVVDGAGDGFGGRSLCLREQQVPEPPYELAVAVKLDDESGAAGLAFDADGADRHYGFYPTAGRLRLTRFEGPDVSRWTILEEVQSEHYRPGDWNTLKVRREADRMLCYVNDRLVIESRDSALPAGKVGLAKFRDTQAQFRGFAVARELAPSEPPAELIEQLVPLVDEAAAADLDAADELVARLLPHADASGTLLRRRARELQAAAERLTSLADSVHRARALEALREATDVADDQIDLTRAALLIARLDNDEVDVAAYEHEVDRMAEEIAADLDPQADEAARLAALDRYLFQQNGFHGSRSEYNNRANSYLNEVIDDREGLPITLSVLYIELARRLKLSVEGVALPGHFLVRHVPAEGEPQLIDPFERGARVARDEAERRVTAATGQPARDEHFQPATRRAILVRMLRNLLGLSQSREDSHRALTYLDAVLLIEPEELEARSMRAILRLQSGDRQGALDDLDWLILHGGDALDLDRVREFREFIENQS